MAQTSALITDISLCLPLYYGEKKCMYDCIIRDGFPNFVRIAIAVKGFADFNPKSGLYHRIHIPCRNRGNYDWTSLWYTSLRINWTVLFIKITSVMCNSIYQNKTGHSQAPKWLAQHLPTQAIYPGCLRLPFSLQTSPPPAATTCNASAECT